MHPLDKTVIAPHSLQTVVYTSTFVISRCDDPLTLLNAAHLRKMGVGTIRQPSWLSNRRCRCDRDLNIGFSTGRGRRILARLKGQVPPGIPARSTPTACQAPPMARHGAVSFSPDRPRGRQAGAVLFIPPRSSSRRLRTLQHAPPGAAISFLGVDFLDTQAPGST